MKNLLFSPASLAGILLLACILLSASTLSASTDPDSLEINNAQSSDRPQAEAAIDSLFSSLLKDFVPTLHPAMVRDRLACMKSQIQMTYHEDVMGWIKFYTVKNRDYTQRILERSTFYFPIFEEALARHGMPDELKYLSIVESALRPEAESWAAAAGLWQFIPSTGKEYGLEQDWFIDERMDIYKSTDAACRYLKFLYKYHGDWQLALAAYNCGPGRVNWAVKQAGGKTASFWKIYNFLPRETRSYVPAFIAASYAMKYADEHFIQAKNPQTFIPSDTLLVSQFLNLEEFARQIEVPVEQMQMLNPHLRKKAIPAYKKNYPLRYPAAKRELVQANRVAILQACNRASLREMPYTAGKTDLSSTTEGKKALTHTVKAGESINYIALQYKVAGSSIRIWNRLASDLIYPNQKLTIWVKAEESPAKPAPAEVAQEAAPSKP
ncbi:MAG: transglycosylase SLT domain-containing protein [Microscillaceae bacterium]|nr:transglycosylase SLT domain-containing protein [Microscillaceae bacterium]